VAKFQPKEDADRLSECFVCRFTKVEAASLDRMVKSGRFGSKNALVRSILCEIIADEEMDRRGERPAADLASAPPTG
jgi:Arc/MetJ-type ribon-helix-helix transcriptional regulator